MNCDSPFNQRHLDCDRGVSVPGGDGGNRTRVRKIRPPEIYERSRLRFVTAGLSIGKLDLRPAVRAQKPSFAPSTASGAALRLCFARLCHRAENGAGGRGLLRDRPFLLSTAYAARGIAA